MFFIKSALKALEKPDKPFIHNVIPAGRSRWETCFPAIALDALNSGEQLFVRGGARRDRTDDLMLAKHALYQLSYGPLAPAPKLVEPVIKIRSPGLSRRVSHKDMWWAQADSNCRPHAYQACALTN
jgi:hypothetical protein